MDDNQEFTEDAAPASDSLEVTLEKPLSLNEQRLKAVYAKITESGAESVLDLGCGDGKLLRDLIKDKSILKIAGDGCVDPLP